MFQIQNYGSIKIEAAILFYQAFLGKIVLKLQFKIIAY